MSKGYSRAVAGSDPFPSQVWPMSARQRLRDVMLLFSSVAPVCVHGPQHAAPFVRSPIKATSSRCSVRTFLTRRRIAPFAISASRLRRYSREGQADQRRKLVRAHRVDCEWWESRGLLEGLWPRMSELSRNTAPTTMRYLNKPAEAFDLIVARDQKLGWARLALFRDG